jgi:hypothetical protein
MNAIVIWFVYMVFSDLVLFMLNWDGTQEESLKSGYWLAWRDRAGCPEGMRRVWGPYVTHVVTVGYSASRWPCVRLWSGDAQWPCSFQVEWTWQYCRFWHIWFFGITRYEVAL